MFVDMCLSGEGTAVHETQILQHAKPCKAALCPKDQNLLFKLRSEPCSGLKLLGILLAVTGMGGDS